jgi:UDP-glucose 4-epimerase
MAMDEPVDTAAVATHLKTTQGLDRSTCPAPITPISSTTRARFNLNLRPRTDLAKLIDAAWTFQRAPDDPRKVWYPG